MHNSGEWLGSLSQYAFPSECTPALYGDGASTGMNLFAARLNIGDMDAPRTRFTTTEDWLAHKPPQKRGKEKVVGGC